MMSGKDAPEGADIQTRGARPLFLHHSSNAALPTSKDQLTGREIFSPAIGAVAKSPSDLWQSLWSTKLDARALEKSGLFADPLLSETAGYFDVLRARLLLLVASNHWSRIAVTSPTPGCGKSFVAANLALSLSRLPACRTVLMDMDLRAPKLAGMFGLAEVPPLGEFLLGRELIESQMRRMGSNLAVALNGQAVPRPYEVLQDPVTISTLDGIQSLLQPDITILDMPPALESDDVLAMAPHLDAILLVVDGTSTTPEDIRRCTSMFDGNIPLAGVVLNKSQDRGTGRLRRKRRFFGKG